MNTLTPAARPELISKCSLPTLPTLTPVDAPTSPTPAAATLSAIKKRAGQALFVALWSLQAVLPRLPLLFPVESDLALSPKLRYRSQYRYPGPEVLRDPRRLDGLSDFEITLYLIDFSPLERVLAAMYLPSRKGQVPFHPVSLFLCILLRRENELSWRGLARLMKGDHGAGWRRLFGFEEGQTPSASGLRRFYHTVGAKVFDQLCPRLITLLREHGLFAEHSTYPGDSPERGISVTQDGMLHPALSRPSCLLATDECYQSLAPADSDPDPDPDPDPNPNPMAPAVSGEAKLDRAPKPDDNPTSPGEAGRQVPAQPPAQGASAVAGAALAAGRPCRARQRGREGCPCDPSACQERCRRASTLDPEARLIHYDGHNQKRGQASQGQSQSLDKGSNKGGGKGINVFGYRSVTDRALDDRFYVGWNLQSTLYPANTDERTIFRCRLDGLQAKYPDLAIGEWLDDSGVGYEDCLNAIWELGALRMVDIRAAPGDQDPAVCLQRGYDAQGRPLCAYGYPMRTNGHDYQARRTKYVCAQVCRRQPLIEGAAITPVKACPYLGEPGSLGHVVNVGKSLPDGSSRLAREIRCGSATWKARYGRRNYSESRNGQLQGMGLKRMVSYGLDHNTRDIQTSDFLLNLHTLGRLVRQATELSPS